jgi:hypothetical protein
MAAEAFIQLVNNTAQSSNSNSKCDICTEVIAEEELRIRELVSCIERNDVAHWLSFGATLCMPHAVKLRRQLPLHLGPRIDAIIILHRQQLTEELRQLRDNPNPDRIGWGALGRAAEFLVAQRGLKG